jgi:DNA-binding transcriptional regulator/RsmH inhibitor MraZ
MKKTRNALSKRDESGSRRKGLCLNDQVTRETAEAIARDLIGFGERVLTFDAGRLHAPADVSRRFGDQKIRLWMATRTKECIRILPKSIWPDYVAVMRRETGGTLSPRAFTVLIEQAATEIKTDRSGRWKFNKELVRKATLSEGSNKSVVVVANRFWLEIWGLSAREAVQQSCLQEAKGAGVLL